MLYQLDDIYHYEEDIKKSRFLAIAAPVQSASDAMAFLEQHSVPDATHNCWAYKIGDEYRFNDDGEPGGTAGRPMLQAIEGQSCDRVVVLVIRWFGGVKLGTGGLVRAYGGVAASCLRLA
ncbi:MAG: YigZ family protein, partial [Alcaligenaceae bacterium]|nr:YigZ family protein [Alcaligenaceae bacterium]